MASLDTLKSAALTAVLAVFLCGCAADRVIVLDRQQDVVRLGRGVRGEVYVWRNGQWIRAGKMTLPEGWYAGPGPESQ